MFFCFCCLKLAPRLFDYTHPWGREPHNRDAMLHETPYNFAYSEKEKNLTREYDWLF
jgi:hypothetical protein